MTHRETIHALLNVLSMHQRFVIHGPRGKTRRELRPLLGQQMVLKLGARHGQLLAFLLRDGEDGTARGDGGDQDNEQTAEFHLRDLHRILEME